MPTGTAIREGRVLYSDLIYFLLYFSILSILIGLSKQSWPWVNSLRLILGNILLLIVFNLITYKNMISSNIYYFLSMCLPKTSSKLILSDRKICPSKLHWSRDKGDVPSSESIKKFSIFEKTKSSRKGAIKKDAPFFVAIIVRYKTDVFRRKRKLRSDRKKGW